MSTVTLRHRPHDTHQRVAVTRSESRCLCSRLLLLQSRRRCCRCCRHCADLELVAKATQALEERVLLVLERLEHRQHLLCGQREAHRSDSCGRDALDRSERCPRPWSHVDLVLWAAELRVVGAVERKDVAEERRRSSASVVGGVAFQRTLSLDAAHE